MPRTANARPAISAQAIPARSVTSLYGAAARTAVLRSSLDWFVFGGRVVGLGSKAGVGHKVNLFQGGTKLAVFQEDTAAGS